MKRAVMIGAGQIGRGFIGMLLEEAGYHVVFADINTEVIEDINRRKEYTVHLVDRECINTTVRNISAIDSRSPELIDEYVRCSLLCTSVGLTAFPAIAPAIARGIRKRRELGVDGCLNVIACENGIGGTTKLKNLVYRDLDKGEQEYADRYVGFPDCAVDRIIPPAKGLDAAEVVVEKYHEWDVEKKGFRGEILDIPGMRVVDDLSAYVERKLFTLNGANVVNGCYGYLKGYQTIEDSLEDGEIFEEVYGIMTEAGQMLSKRHGFSPEEMKQYRDTLIQRFRNPYVVDNCVRVAREPIRKLAPDDRIIAPMKYALSYGLDIFHYMKGIALILLYNNPDDQQSQELQQAVAQYGVRGTLEKYCGIAPDSEVASGVEDWYKSLQQTARHEKNEASV